MDGRGTEFPELLRTKYGIFIKKSQNSVFYPELFRKFCTAFFFNHLYPRLLNSSVQLTELMSCVNSLLIHFELIEYDFLHVKKVI